MLRRLGQPNAGLAVGSRARKLRIERALLIAICKRGGDGAIRLGDGNEARALVVGVNGISRAA